MERIPCSQAIHDMLRVSPLRTGKRKFKSNIMFIIRRTSLENGPIRSLQYDQALPDIDGMCL